ncbi:hypothetical protein ABI_07280 [Asticcacaulis biprosthecium C19]|uniref:Uncharacterized protein n=1 Tax=Asticcacaulis biprosthecium C19 TaxID=715226 RepID=F4QLE9_9CAUL|nr:hypothetical protein ABI_07280 [Asticcacaulis biprosthecium C19]
MQKPVLIVARNFDHSFDPDDEDNEPGAGPMSLGPDGRLYSLSFVYASVGGPWQTVAEAKAWANSQAWGPVKWEDEG